VTMSPSAPCDRLCQVARTSALALTPQLTGLEKPSLDRCQSLGRDGVVDLDLVVRAGEGSVDARGFALV